jgi:site-specific DNA-methyltransferase (adenine-specific)
VVAVESGKSDSVLLPQSKKFEELVSSRKPFGLDTTFKGKTVKGKNDLIETSAKSELAHERRS